jgi:hypothetical protein
LTAELFIKCRSRCRFAHNVACKMHDYSKRVNDRFGCGGTE